MNIALKIGCAAPTLRERAKKHEVLYGPADGVTSEESDRTKSLELEVKELRWANEVLRLASAFFAQAEFGRWLNS